MVGREFHSKKKFPYLAYFSSTFALSFQRWKQKPPFLVQKANEEGMAQWDREEIREKPVQ